jgi:hypothetical protein
MLAELVENIATMLTALPPEDWGVLKVPTDIQIVKALDPDTIIKSMKSKIYVMPVVRSNSMERTLGRGKILQSVTKQLTVSVSLVVPFSTFQVNDVASWAEIKKILELREKLEDNSISLNLKDSNFNYEYTLVEIESEAPIEVELNQRNFLAATDFIYEVQRCGS